MEFFDEIPKPINSFPEKDAYESIRAELMANPNKWGEIDEYVSTKDATVAGERIIRKLHNAKKAIRTQPDGKVKLYVMCIQYGITEQSTVGIEVLGPDEWNAEDGLPGYRIMWAQEDSKAWDYHIFTGTEIKDLARQMREKGIIR